MIEARIGRVQPIKRKVSKYAIEIDYQKKVPISVRESLILFRLELKNMNYVKKTTEQNTSKVPSKTNKQTYQSQTNEKATIKEKPDRTQTTKHSKLI